MSKLTKPRANILRKLSDDAWHRWDEFQSANSLSSLRRTTFSRRAGRGLPWNATGQPMEDAGWISVRHDRYSRTEIRITDAGRAALMQGGE